MDIKSISKQINDNAHAKGFWDKGMNVPEKLLLIISEVTEAMEADRIDAYCERKDRTDGRPLGSWPEGHKDEFTEAEWWFKEAVKDKFEDELADVAIRVFDLAYEMGFDLSWHIQQKVRYNAGRPKMHGGKKY